ncbi:MAG: hypothetical protein ACTSPG_03600 [Candidatus Hodarchaeales archaeon]
MEAKGSSKKDTILKAINVYDSLFNNKTFQVEEFEIQWDEWFNWFAQKKSEFYDGKIPETTFYRQLKRLNDFFKTKTSVPISILPTFAEKIPVSVTKTPEEIRAEEAAKNGLTFCDTCGEYKKTVGFFCPDCGMRLQDDRARKLALSKPRYSPSGYYHGRPTGITILCILVAVGVFQNIINVISNITSIPLFSAISLFFTILQILVIYGLWNMKTWGANITMGTYGFEIITKLIMMVAMPEVITDLVMADPGYTGDFASRSEVLTIVQTGLTVEFFITLIIGLIIIKYLISRRKYFVN